MLAIVNEMKMEFPSRSANEALARSAAAQMAASLDPTLDELSDIKTAVSEAVTNAVVHAYPVRLGTVWLRARILEGNILEVVVRDKGVGIDDVDNARRPMVTTGGDERSGMGFTIMENFMDSVKVRSAPGRGTAVTMRKRVETRSPRA